MHFGHFTCDLYLIEVGWSYDGLLVNEQWAALVPNVSMEVHQQMNEQNCNIPVMQEVDIFSSQPHHPHMPMFALTGYFKITSLV